MAITDPSDLSDLLVWLDPSSGCYVERTSPTTVCTDGTKVGTWVARTGQTFVAPSDAARPTWYANGGQPYLDFDGSDDVLANAGVSLDVSSMEVWVGGAGHGSSPVDIGNGSQRLYYTGGHNGSGGAGVLYMYDGVGFRQTPVNTYWPKVAFTPHGYAITGGNIKFLVNGWESANVGGAFSSATGTGVSIGQRASGGFAFQGRLSHIIICDAPLTGGTSRADLLTWLRTQIGAKEYSAQVLCCGDSLTAGYNSTLNVILNGFTGGDVSFGYPYAIANAKRQWKVFNNGITSKKVVTMTADDDTGVDPYLDATTFDHNVCVIWGGTNDLVLDDTSLATLQTRFSDYCTARTGAGWTVVAVEMMDRTDFTSGQRTIRGQFNSWLAGQEGTLFTKLVTLPTQLAGTSPWSTHSSYWDSDNTHLTKLGYQTIAASIQSKISSIVGSSVGGPGFGIGTFYGE